MNTTSVRHRDGRERPYRHGTLHPDALEFVADLLLESAGRDSEYPAYSEEYLVRRTRRAFPGRRLDWPHYTCTDLLLLAEIDDLSKCARLTADEDAAWRMTLDGCLPEEIAETLGTSRTRVVRLLTSARGRVASCGSKLRGLHSAYLSLICRRGCHQNQPSYPARLSTRRARSSVR